MYTVILPKSFSCWPSWPWSDGSWLDLKLLMQSVPITINVSLNPTQARCTRRNTIIICDKVCQWIATGRWFSPGTPVYSTNKTDSHDITEIFLKVALNTINLTKPKSFLSGSDTKTIINYSEAPSLGIICS